MRGKGMSNFVVSIFTLISASVEIGNDRLGGTKTMSGENKDEIIQPVSLSYDFVIKNTGKDTLGSAEKMNTEICIAEN